MRLSQPAMKVADSLTSSLDSNRPTKLQCTAKSLEKVTQGTAEAVNALNSVKRAETLSSSKDVRIILKFIMNLLKHTQLTLLIGFGV